ncbi:MAG: DUF2344 domain-containing protein [Ruminococcaceae bacterium]|nr:DUF2344 domain-containing protein [Oscillospiraceae bacterium]
MKSVRVFYKKSGRMKFISHLDMNRFMIRMVRMSGIPVWYSEGFNPHPYITFALPLSLGFNSNYEVMDIRLNDDDYPLDSVCNNLKKLMPKGIEIFKVDNPVMKAGDVAFAEFRIEFDDISLYRKEIIEFLSSEKIEAEKKTKKGGVKIINLKEFISEFNVDGNSLILILSAGSNNNLNPKLILDTFDNTRATNLPSYSITRCMLYNSNMECFK